MTPINLDEDFTRAELEKIRDAFYFGDIGSHAETGFKLLHKDEDTINLIGKVVTTLVNNKLKETEFKCDQCEKSFTEDQMTTTGGDEIYCQACLLEKVEEIKKEKLCTQ